MRWSIRRSCRCKSTHRPPPPPAQLLTLCSPRPRVDGGTLQWEMSAAPSLLISFHLQSSSPSFAPGWGVNVESVGRSASDELQAVAEMDDETSLVMVLLRGSWGWCEKSWTKQ